MTRRRPVLVSVVGARPQFIKAAMVHDVLARARWAQHLLIHTGQHYDPQLSAVFFRELTLPEPAEQLQVGSGPHGRQTGRMLERLEPVLQRLQPDAVLVYGDTNSTLAGALVAAKLQQPIVHIEAGLRSFRRGMAEEINRVVTDHLSEILCCPTATSIRNLAAEGITRGVFHTGDVMVDALACARRAVEASVGELARWAVQPRGYALMTVHRAENTDEPTHLRAIIEALRRVALPILWPVHPRAQAVLQRYHVRLPANVRMVPPVSYLEMLRLERFAAVVLTDSGGVQKEAWCFGVPCVILRQETEWIELLSARQRTVRRLTPSAIESAYHAVVRQGPKRRTATIDAVLGPKAAAERICRVLQQVFGTPRASRTGRNALAHRRAPDARLSHAVSGASRPHA